jgi:hypothetical protein
MGLEAAGQRADELHSEAMDSLEGFDASADPLRLISLYIIERER